VNNAVFVPRNNYASQHLVWSPTQGSRQAEPNEVYQSPAKSPSFVPSVTATLPTAFEYEGTTSSLIASDYMTQAGTPVRHAGAPFLTSGSSSDAAMSYAGAPVSHTGIPLGHARAAFTTSGGFSYATESHTGTPMSYGREAFTTFSSPTNAIPSHAGGMPKSLTVPPGKKYRAHFRGIPNPLRIPYARTHSSSTNRTTEDEAALFHMAAGTSFSVPNPSGSLPYRRGLNPTPFNPRQAASNYRPGPEIWGAQHSTFVNLVTETFLDSASDQPVTIPEQGHMSDVDYWDVLHEREAIVRHQLATSKVQLTEPRRQYIGMLCEARIRAVSTKLPARGQMDTRRWLKTLDYTMKGIWQPGDEARGGIIVARKADFQIAVNRAIEAAVRELD